MWWARISVRNGERSVIGGLAIWVYQKTSTDFSGLLPYFIEISIIFPYFLDLKRKFYGK